MEFRPLVIRRAVERSAHPLALMHLRSPSEEVERLLLGVLVSAYRVLDPRRRDDPQSRIMLGRIHPQLADEAVQLAQTRWIAPQGPSQSGPQGPATDGAPVGLPRWMGEESPLQFPPIAERSPALPPAVAEPATTRGSAPTVEVQLITSERFLDAAAVPGWDCTLSSSDLLTQPAVKRGYRAIRRQFAGFSPPSKIAATMLAASVLMVMTWRTTVWLRSSGEQQPMVIVVGPLVADAARGPREVISSASGLPAAVDAVDLGTAAETLGDVAAAVQTPEQPAAENDQTKENVGSPHPPLAITDPIAQSGGEGTTESPPTLSPVDFAALGDLDALVGSEETSGSRPVDSIADLVVPGLSAGAVDAGDRVTAGDRGVEVSDSALLSGQPGALQEESLPALEADAKLDAVVKLAAVPSQSQQASARLQLEALIRSQASGAGNTSNDQLVATNAAGQQLVLLESLARDAQAGSAERWVAMIMAGQAAMLAGRAEDTERAISELTESFDVGLGEGSLRLARWAATDVVTEQQRQSVAAWIDEKVRSFVLEGDLAVAGQLVAVAQELGTKHRDESIKAQSKLWRDSLAVAQRYAEGAQQVRSRADAQQPSAEEQGLAGRYWALVRRDWHRALPYLAAGTNAKLAHYAGIELLAGASLDAQDATTLADGYVGEAKRAKGWLADSYILHAHELLLLAAKGASETKSLELARAAEKLKLDHPRAFHEPVMTGAAKLAKSSRPVGGASASELPAEVAVELGEAGMLGRVKIAGQDVGALVRYEPGMTLSTKLVDQIATQLQLATVLSPGSLGPIEMEFVGVISVDQPTTISLSLLPISDGAMQRIAIDGQVLPIESATTTGSSQRYDVDLLQGDYLLRWTATLAAEDRLSIRVIDESSGQMVPVNAPPPTMPGHPGRLPTRLRVSLVVGE